MLTRAFLVAQTAEVTTVPTLEKDVSMPMAEVSPPLPACALGRESWDERNVYTEVLSPQGSTVLGARRAPVSALGVLAGFWCPEW